MNNFKSYIFRYSAKLNGRPFIGRIEALSASEAEQKAYRNNSMLKNIRATVIGNQKLARQHKYEV